MFQNTVILYLIDKKSQCVSHCSKNIFLTYRIIAKTRRSCTKMSTLMNRLILETLLNSMFFAILVGLYSR